MHRDSRWKRLAYLLPLALLACDGGTEPFVPPPPPAEVSVAALSHTDALISWAPPENRTVSEFEVERAEGSSNAFTTIATVPGTVLSYQDVGLTPATTYRYRVRSCTAGGCSTPTTAIQITTHAPLVITSTALADAVTGEAYNEGLNASGGTGEEPGSAAQGDYTWTLIGGSLPAGLTLSERGIISGIPTTVQTASFTVRVRSGDGQTATRDFEIEVLAEHPPETLVVVTPRLPPALRGAPYGVELTAGGGAGPPYTWTVSGGALPPGMTLNQGGVFSGSPTSAGTFGFTVRVASGAQTATASFSLEVAPHDQTSFGITLFEVSTVPASIRPHVLAAAERWEAVIVGDLGSGQIPRGFFSSTFCGGFGHLVNGTSVDDIIVMVDISPIDGRGKILGQAGPCGLRDDDLPFAGTLTLDSDDLEPVAGTQTLTDIVFHEIGHILGFGILWDGMVTGGGTSDPRYTGENAVGEYFALGRTGNVPLENQGGEGTADSHWRETVFNAEIMTGYTESTSVKQPLSRVTIAAMEDIGYQVSYGPADAYSLPGALQAPGPALEDRGHDVVLKGPVRVLPLSGGSGGGP
jgi:hypothetical protein